MVNLTIDGRQISVEENTTIMEAARSVGIQIPSLCYLKGINEIGACRVCVVELEGKDRLITACNNICKEGMVIYTNSPKVRKDRRTTVELILSEHDCQCVTCMRSGNCSLQKIANDLDIIELPFHQYLEHQPWDKTFPLIRDSAKCIKCMRCVQVCDKVQGLGVWDVEGTGYHTTVNVSGHNSIREADCALCGQCITHCPVGALRERSDTNEVWKAIEDPDKIVVAQVAPAVRAAWGEELGLAPEDATVGKIIDALKRMGINYVFDTTFSADLTIMEEGNEFVKRFTSGELKDRPMFTSCCPGWVRFIKSQFPHLVKYLSSAKSPQQMFGAVMKTYFAEKLGVSPEKIYTVSVMPCVAKKAEREMDLYYEEYAGHDIDAVITTRELIRMIRSAHISPQTLVDVESDRPMHEGTGAGVIFGATGGVMEAALRAYPGRALINSISLETEKIEKLLPLAKKYGAMFILLPLSDEGLPKSLAEKKEIINTILEKAKKLGVSKNQIIVDGLVTTVGANKNAALETLETIRYCKEDLKLCTTMGLSNISFGLPERPYVNGAFASMAIASGLTMAIANPSNQLLMGISFASDLLRNKEGSDIAYIEQIQRMEPLKEAAIAKAAKTAGNGEKQPNEKNAAVGEADGNIKKNPVFEAVLKGNKDGIVDVVKKELSKGTKPGEILDGLLIPAINEVGVLFDKQKYFLPQLISSANTMEQAVEYLEPLLKEGGIQEKMPTIIIATVEGDIHDIGKNLVALMLRNYGYDVIDLGKDVPADEIIAAAKEHNASIIVLSALMTTTMMRMKDTIALKEKEHLDVKVMIGGAVTTQSFADEIGADGYSADAADAVRLAKKLLAE